MISVKVFFKRLNRRVLYWSVAMFALGTVFGLTSLRERKAYQDPNNLFVVGTNAEYAPYEFKDEKGAIIGFDVDLAFEIAKRLGKDLVIKDMSFDSLIMALNKGEVDAIISALAITRERQNKLDLIPYFGSDLKKYALVFPGKPPRGVKSLDDLSQLKRPVVSVMLGSVQDAFMTKYVSMHPKIELRRCDNPSEVVLDIQYGKSHAFLCRHDMAEQVGRSLPKVRVIDVPLSEEEWTLGDGIAVRKDRDDGLCEKIASIVKELKDEGFIAWQEKKWKMTKI